MVVNDDMLRHVALLASKVHAPFQVRWEAMLCLQDILSAQPLNAGILLESGCLSLLVACVEEEMQLAPSYVGELGGDDKLYVFVSLLDTLSYAAVLLSMYDLSVTTQLSDVLLAASPFHTFGTQLLADALVRIILDARSRHVGLPPALLRTHLEVLRRLCAELPTMSSAPFYTPRPRSVHSLDGLDAERADEPPQRRLAVRPMAALVLEAVALLVEGTVDGYAVLEELSGGKLIYDMVATAGGAKFAHILFQVLTTLCADEASFHPEACELALWLLQDLTTRRIENLHFFKWCVDLLRPDVLFRLRPSVQVKCCQMVSGTLHDSHFQLELRNLLKDLPGVHYVLEILRRSSGELADAALGVLEDSYAGDENSKLSLISSIGYGDLLAALAHAKDSFTNETSLAVLELAVVGDLRAAFGVFSMRPGLFSGGTTVTTHIEDIVAPRYKSVFVSCVGIFAFCM